MINVAATETERKLGHRHEQAVASFIASGSHLNVARGRLSKNKLIASTST